MGLSNLHPLRSIAIDTSLFPFRPNLNGMIHISSDELWFGFGNSIISVALLSSSQNKDEIVSKTKQQIIPIKTEESIQCFILVNFREQKYLWIAETLQISIWKILKKEEEKMKKIGTISLENERKEGGQIQMMKQIGNEV